MAIAWIEEDRIGSLTARKEKNCSQELAEKVSNKKATLRGRTEGDAIHSTRESKAMQRKLKTMRAIGWTITEGVGD